MPAPNSRLDSLYQYITEEEDARVCTDISDEACRVVPGNFFRIFVSNIFSKLGDELGNAKTTLPWLMAFAQAPPYLTSLLVPIREAGSLLPQLLIAAYVRKLGIRKWAWVTGSVLQGMCMALIGLAATRFSGAGAGFLIIALLMLFSLARGLCSVAHKDVLGKTVPKTRRGRLGGLSSSIAGLVAMAVGLLFWKFDLSDSELAIINGLLLTAAACWICAALVYSSLRESAGETDGGGNALTHAVQNLKLLADDAPFRRFVIVRSLLLCSALSAPLYIQLGSASMQASIQTLGIFIVANGIAALVSSPVWGRYADASSRQVMMAAATVSGMLGLVLVTVETLFAEGGMAYLVYPGAFLILGIAHNGVRLGRKTYLVDMSTGNTRTSYVAVSNTVIGGVLLLFGAATAGLAAYSVQLAIVALSLSGLAGAVMARSLKEVSEKEVSDSSTG